MGDQFDSEVLDLLACPCPRHQPLAVGPGPAELHCLTCATRFPVVDGVPVLLLDEAQPGPEGIGGAQP